MFHRDQQIGSYVLIRRLGAGSFGDVWLAENRSSLVAKRVVVKLLLDNQTDFERIRLELKLTKRIGEHANVLSVIDADVFDGQAMIISEFAENGSLADLIKRDGNLAPQKAIEIIAEVLDGLEFLHSRYIIHRNIHPANVLFQGDTPRLADFGISRATDDETITGEIAYLSPESFNGECSVQTDVWSVGVVLYQLLEGKLPFPQESFPEMIFAILTKDFEPLPPEIPLNLGRIVERALAKKPENRYRTAAEMREDLSPLLKTEEPASPLGAICPHCGNEHDADYSFCNMCGEPLSEDRETDSQINYAPPETFFPNANSSSIARDDADKTRKTDSVSNLVKRVRRFFGGETEE